MPDFPSLIDLGALTASQGFKIQGDADETLLGFSVSGAGDVNGGVDDLLVAAPFNDRGANNAGAAYVIYGMAATNTAPSGADETRTIGVSYALRAADFGFSDSDGDHLQAVTITTLPGAGTLYFDANGALGGVGPVAVTAGESISAADIAAGHLTFVAAPGASGSSASFTFQVQDDGGTAAGGVDLDPTPNTLTFNVLDVYDPPATFPSLIDLATLGGDGFKIQGDADGDHAGIRVSAAGDFNGDGFADIIVGAGGSNGGGTSSGAAYLIFGHANGFGPIDLGSLTASQGFEILGAPSDRTGSAVSAAGDVNGDGFADIIIGASGNDAVGYNAGAAYVIFGHASGFGTVDLSTPLTASQGFKIQGEATSDYAGLSVSAAGDVNGDGIADLMVGAPQNDGGGDGAGAAYVIYGTTSGFGTIDLGALTASQGFKIQGEAFEDYAGTSISTAGDVNGDGIADIIVGAYANDGGGNNKGAAYVIFGHTGESGTIDLTTLTASQGFKIQGNVNNVLLGISVAGAGDVNGDGIADIVIGADSDSAGGGNAGAAYVIFGQSGGFGTIDLGALTASQGFKIVGGAAADLTGRSVSSAGDVNGDGFADIIVGAPTNSSGGTSAGAAYLIFGHAGGFGTIDLGALTASQGFKIQGETDHNYAGFSVSAAGDVNGDGMDDLMVGAFGNDSGGNNAGAAYVIFGRPNNAAPTGTDGTRTIGASYALHAADFGFSDSDGNHLQAVTITTLPTAGTLYFDANGALGGGPTAVTAGQSISAADIAAGHLTFVAAAGASGDGYASFTFQVQDDGTAGTNQANLDPTPNTLTFNVLDVYHPTPGIPSLIDLTTLGGDGFKIQGDAVDDEAGFSVSGAGDVNGDGFADVIVGVFDDASGGEGAGAAYVIFGQASGFGLVDLGTLTASQGFKIQGGATYDYAGYSVSGAGDVNGDGFADVIVGSADNEGGGADNGAAYVIFGHAGTFSPIDLATLTASQGFKIRGDARQDDAGYSVSAAGDVNGDGFADVIVGARFNDAGGTDAGAAYVIFGHSGGFGTIDLGTALDPSQGFKILGDADGDRLAVVSAAGDVNGDGFADVIVGARFNDAGGTDAGTAYVIFGHSGGFGTIDLGTALDPSQGFKIVGDAAGDSLGGSVSAAGDLNGDGIADLIVGAPFNDAGGANAGAAYVIFGHTGGFGTIDLGTPLTGSQGFTILGDVGGDSLGRSVSAAGDFNGDGFADIIVGAPENGGGGTLAGAAYVIFGHAGGFGTIDLGTTLDPRQGFKIQGDASDNEAGVSVSAAGDVNGDGYADILVGAPLQSGGGFAAGAAYVIFGRPQAAPAVDLNGADAGTGATLAYTENQGATAIAPAATVTDTDSPDLGTGTLTVAFTANGAAEDRLVIIDQGAGAGHITVSGSNVSYGGTLIGTFTGGTDGATPLVVTLNAAATPAAAQALVEDIGYLDTSDNPSISARSLSFTLSDGDGGTSIDVAATVNVTAVNDAPSGADKTIALLEDSGAYVLTVADFGFSDVDGNNFTFFLLNGTPSSGTLFFDPDGAGPQAAAPAVSGQFIQASQVANGQLFYVPAANGNGTPYADFNFQVFDDGGTANGGSNFDPTSNHITFNVSPVNDPPIVDLNGAAAGTSTTLSYTENAPATAIAAGATVTDLDTTNYDGGHLLVQMTNGLNAEDVLSIINQGNGTGQIGYASGVISYQGVAIADLLPAPMSPFPVLDIAFRPGTIAPSAVEALVRAIGYTNLSDTPTVAPDRTISFTLRDGDGTANGGADTGIATATISVTAVDDPAVARNDAVATNEATILGGNVLSDNGFGTDSDVDGPALTVSAVNGSATAVGHQVTLASGALLTLGTDGSFAYNPNHAFDATPAPGSGASNTPAHDSFTYTLTGGGTATVTVTIAGVDSNDLLRGTPGHDVLVGGSGDDAYIIDQAGDVVTELAGGGHDTVYTLVSYALAAGSEVETLTAYDRATTNAMSLTGNEFDNVIYGNAGANALIGGGGTDTMYGLGGDDAYLVDSGGDQAIELAGQGNDTVYTTVSYTLTAGSEIETLTVYDRTTTNALTLTGNGFNNTIIGNNGGNALIGGGGTDIMYGLGGNDSYIVDSASDQAIESAGQGNDTVYTTVSYTLTAGSEIETLTAYDRTTTNALTLTGNAFDNIIFGNEGADALIGGGGTDTMYGLGGNDSYIVDSASEQVIEFAGQGNDTVYTSVSYTLTAGSEIETLTVYDRTSTNALVLTGNGFDNVIFGNNGGDALIGGGGNDTMYGLGGDDAYIVDSASDQVIEFAGQGNDTVYTSVSYALTAGSEIETLTVYDRATTNALVLAGNEFDNVIIGNNGSDALIGGGGNDTMYGLGGDDAYIVDSASDQAIEGVGQGNDTVYTSVSYTLTAGSEIETLTAYDRTTTNALTLTGNDLANSIIGNNGADIIDGKGGNDILYGLGGADIFTFTAAPGAGNADTIADFLHGTDTIALDHAAFTGLTAGPLAAGAFVIGTAAQDADDRIVYDQNNGNLYFDADGNGGQAQVLIAHLSGQPVLAASDFSVI